jgi:hypothetical protein
MSGRKTKAKEILYIFRKEEWGQGQRSGKRSESHQPKARTLGFCKSVLIPSERRNTSQHWVGDTQVEASLSACGANSSLSSVDSSIKTG